MHTAYIHMDHEMEKKEEADLSGAYGSFEIREAVIEGAEDADHVIRDHLAFAKAMAQEPRSLQHRIELRHGSRNLRHAVRERERVKVKVRD